MKTKIFKTVLPTLALILAIAASFAFTPTGNSMAEYSMVTSGYIQNPDEGNCIAFSPINCNTVNQFNGFCTVTLTTPSPTIYRLYLMNFNNKCNVALYKP